MFPTGPNSRRPRRSACLALFLLAASGGCAGFWDDVTSQSFRNEPFKTLFVKPEPMSVLRDPGATGDQRVRAMQRLEEPLSRGGSPAEQDEALEILTRTATSDRLALCRLAAIEALSRFKDPRATEALVSAYHNAEGNTRREAGGDSGPLRFVKPAGLSEPIARTFPVLSSPADPDAFSPEVVTAIRVKALEALGESGSAAALPLLADVARRPVELPQGEDDEPLSEPSGLSLQQQREVRMAAVRALGRFPADARAAEPLVEVLRDTKDVALRDRAHEGLVRITGLDLPPDPEGWDAALRQGVPAPAAPEPNPVRRVAAWLLN